MITDHLYKQFAYSYLIHAWYGDNNGVLCERKLVLREGKLLS